jgi:hypothetical protein
MTKNSSSVLIGVMTRILRRYFDVSIGFPESRRVANSIDSNLVLTFAHDERIPLVNFIEAY